MVALFLSGAILFYLCFVFGFYFSKLFRLKLNFSDILLLGLVVTNTAASLLSLFFPLNVFSQSVILLISFILLFLVRDEIGKIKESILTSKWILLLSFPFIIYAFLIALGAPQHYDTGLYHLQSIKWIETYPAVPGLANLHTRFGFNSNIFTVYALTSASWLFGQEIFAVNLVIFSVLVIYLIDRLFSIHKNSGVSNMLIFNLLVLTSIIRLSQFLSSPAPDYAASAFCIYILARLLDPAGQSEKSINDGYYALAILTVYAITIKLTLLPLVTAFFLIFIRFRTPLFKMLMITAICLVILLPWLTRFVILTGWLIYPLTSIDIFNFDWKLPAEITAHEKLAITGWARMPGEQWIAAAQMNFMEWFPEWWNRHSGSEHKRLIAAFLFPVVTLAGVLISKIKLQMGQIAAIVAVFLSLVYWLMMAPDLRFGESFLSMAVICPVVFLTFRINLSWSPFYKPDYLFILIIFYIFMNFVSFNTGNGYVSGSIHRKLHPEKIEVPQGYGFKSEEINGITVYSPVGNNDQCFDHCIPCTPYPDRNLVLRKKNLRSGFRLRRAE